MIAELVEKLYAQRPENTLYHYTSFQGVMGIVKGGSLRATEIHFLNDEAEMNHTANLLQHAIVQRLKEGKATLVPFMRFELPKASDRQIDIEHVFLGPTPNLNNSMTSLSNYLSKNGASPRQGLASCQIPYRTC